MEPKIRAVNKKTGQVFEGSVEEARKFGFSDEFILNKIKTQEELQNVLEGDKPKAIESTQDVLNIAKDLPSSGERTGAQDAVLFAEQVKKALDLLGKSEEKGILGVKGSGPLVNLLTTGAEKLGADTAQGELRDQLDNLRQLIRKERTGVVFSDKELAELERIFGSISTQEAPLRRKLENLLSTSVNEASAKTGADRDQLTKLLEVQAPERKRGNLLDFLLGGTKDVMTDVVQGQTQKQINPQLEQQLQQAEELAKKGDFEASSQIAKSVSGQAQESAGKFSQQVKDNPQLNDTSTAGGALNALLRGVGSGVEVATVAEAPALIKGGTNLVKNLFNKAPEAVSGVKGALQPIKTAGNARKAAAQVLEDAGEKIVSKDLQQIAQEMLDAKIVTRKEVDTIKKLAEGTGAKPTEALELLVKAGKKSFTKSGDPRITKAADFYSLLRDGLRDEFQNKAPEVIKQTTKMAKTQSFRKAAKSAATTTGLAAGGVGGGVYLLNLLRKGVTGQ